MIKILVVEDEKPISDLIRMNLEDVGYTCTCAYDGIAAADCFEKENFDLVLLDIMLPKADGYELLEYIRPTGVPVIFLTAKSALEERVKGLRLGAEDYIVKPFEIVELLARVQVVLRRYHKAAVQLQFGDIELHTENRTVMQNGKPVELTPKEFTLLEILVRNKNITMFRDKLYELVWEDDRYGETRTLDLHIQRLRKKLGLTEALKTVYKIGYRLEDV